MCGWSSVSTVVAIDLILRGTERQIKWKPPKVLAQKQKLRYFLLAKISRLLANVLMRREDDRLHCSSRTEIKLTDKTKQRHMLRNNPTGMKCCPLRHEEYCTVCPFYQSENRTFVFCFFAVSSRRSSRSESLKERFKCLRRFLQRVVDGLLYITV